MGGKSSAPAPPDYGPLANASRDAAEVSARVAREQLAWAKDQYFMDREVTDLVIETALDRLDTQDEAAGRDRERYEGIFQPLEDELAAEASDYANPERMEFDAGQAQADVSQQFELARTAAQDQLESYGIDPSQTRAGALDVVTRTQEAAARASAGNQARRQTEAVGRALRSEAINVGRGYPGQIAQTYGTALQSGNQAVNSGIATTSTGAQSMGTAPQWQGLSNQAIGQWWQGTNQMYSNQVDAYKAESSQSSGLGSLAGLAGGVLMKGLPAGFLSDEKAKENIEPVGETYDGQKIYRYNYKGDPRPQIGLIAQEVERAIPEAVSEDDGYKTVDYGAATEGAVRRGHFADGGAIPDEAPQHSGIPVDPSMSPSGGRQVDDVPARLNAGEFIVPKDVVSWKGEEYMQRLIESSRKAKEGATAKPEYKPAPRQAPVINTALPVG